MSGTNLKMFTKAAAGAKVRLLDTVHDAFRKSQPMVIRRNEWVNWKTREEVVDLPCSFCAGSTGGAPFQTSDQCYHVACGGCKKSPSRYRSICEACYVPGGGDSAVAPDTMPRCCTAEAGYFETIGLPSVILAKVEPMDKLLEVLPQLDEGEIRHILAEGYDCFDPLRLAMVLHAWGELTKKADKFKMTAEIQGVLDAYEVVETDFDDVLDGDKVEALFAHVDEFLTLPEIDVVLEGGVMVPSVYYELAVRLAKRTFPDTKLGVLFKYDEDHCLWNADYYWDPAQSCVALFITRNFDLMARMEDEFAFSAEIEEMYENMMNPRDIIEEYMASLGENKDVRDLIKGVPMPVWLEEREDKYRIVGLLSRSAPWFNYHGRSGSAALFQQAAELFVISLDQVKEVDGWLNSDWRAAKRPHNCLL